MLARRRYYTWLIKAHLRHSYKVILSSLILGVAGFFIVIGFFNLNVKPHFQKSIQKIGYPKIVTPDSIPDDVLHEVSYGLTVIDEKGNILPGAAERWEIGNDGKTYTFHLKKNLTFHNGEHFVADSLSLTFEDVSLKKINDYTVIYELQDQYAPFLTSVAKPIFTQDFSGLGPYRISDITINGGFVRSISLENVQDKVNKKIINFYPTEEAVKDAFLLGDIDIARGLGNTRVMDGDFSDWPNVEIEKETDYTKLVTLFYNTSDESLSNKNLRKALQNMIPDSIKWGERSYSSIPEFSPYFTKTVNFGITEPEIAKTLLDSPEIDLTSEITVSTLKEYEEVALMIASAWEKVGIRAKVEIVEGIPREYQVFLFSFNVKPDPDQYALWHSEQSTNLSRYKNLRIDKLLEDGRKEVDFEDRKALYGDFQKYLLDDVPASFLYFPYKYTVTRN